MPYKVETTQAFDEKVMSWGLPRDLVVRFLRGVRERLSSGDIEEVGRRIVAPVRVVVVKFVLDDTTLGRRFEFVVWVEDTASRDTRTLVDALYRPIE